jgi:hypothetical protein
MVIIQFIMGFIMGIYLMEILSGHLATQTVLAALNIGGSHPEGRHDNSYKDHFDDNQG